MVGTIQQSLVPGGHREVGRPCWTLWSRETTMGAVGQIWGRGGHRGVWRPRWVPRFLPLLSAPRRQATEEPPATAENLRPFNLVIPFTVQKGEITGTGRGGGSFGEGGHGPRCGAQWGAGQPPPARCPADAVAPGEVRMPSGKTARPNITDNKDGTVTVRYAPTEKGLHEMDIRYDGNHIPGETTGGYWEALGGTGRHWEAVEQGRCHLALVGHPWVEQPTVVRGVPVASPTVVPRVPRESPPVLRGRHQPPARERLRAGAEPRHGQQALHLHHRHQGRRGG